MKLIKEAKRLQQLAGITEITVNKPSGGGGVPFSSNKELYEFLNKNINAFAEHELYNTTVGYYVLQEFFNQVENTDEFTEDELGEIEGSHTIDELSQDLQLRIKDRLINILIETGLDYYGEYPDDEANGISWNIEIGRTYSNQNESDEGSYSWDKEIFKRRKFYSLSYNI